MRLTRLAFRRRGSRLELTGYAPAARGRRRRVGTVLLNPGQKGKDLKGSDLPRWLIDDEVADKPD